MSYFERMRRMPFGGSEGGRGELWIVVFVIASAGMEEKTFRSVPCACITAHAAHAAHFSISPSVGASL